MLKKQEVHDTIVINPKISMVMQAKSKELGRIVDFLLDGT